MVHSFRVATKDFSPARVVEIELSDPLPMIDRSGFEGQHYDRAIVLVYLHTVPLGIIELDLVADQLYPDDYMSIIFQELCEDINQYLVDNRLSAIQTLSIDSIQNIQKPLFLIEREIFLSKAPFVTVVVPTRDRDEQLKICLDSLLAQAYPNYEILLIDNAPSTSKTRDMIEHDYHSVSNLRYICEKRPGASWARNRGIQEAQGELVAFTDDDVRVNKHWLASIAQAFSRADNVGGVNGLTLPAEMETKAQVLFEQFNAFGNGFKRIIHNVTTKPLHDPLYPYNSLNYAASVNMAYQTHILRQLGGFDPALGPGSLAKSGEDVDFYLRCVLNGYTIVYEPTAVIFHYHRRDYTYFTKQTYDYGVAFTAFVTKFIIHNPQHLWHLVGKMPQVVKELFGNSSTKKVRRDSDFPKELKRNEYLGWLYGPVAYIRSRKRVKQIIGEFGNLEL